MIFLLVFLFPTTSTRLVQVYLHHNYADAYPLEGHSDIQFSPILTESDYDQCNTNREIDGNVCVFLQSFQYQDTVTHFNDTRQNSFLRSIESFIHIPRSPPFFVV